MFTRDYTEMLTRTPADIDYKMRIKTKQGFGVNLGLVGLKTVSGKLQVKSGPCQVGGIFCIITCIMNAILDIAYWARLI